MSVATVAVLVAIENWTKWPLVEPSTQVTCGIDDKLPSQILPGYSEMGLFEKSVRYLSFTRDVYMYKAKR